MAGAALRNGSATLEYLFAKYDDDGNGRLESAKFEHIAVDCGFTVGSEDTFASLGMQSNVLKGGGVNYRVLAESIYRRAEACSPVTKAMLTMWAPDEDYDEIKEGDDDVEGRKPPMRYDITGRNKAAVLSQLHEQLNESGLPVADLVKLFDFDADASLTIDSLEFYKALRDRFGFTGTIFLSDSVFKSIDVDRNRLVGFDELFEFVRGRRHSLDHRTKRVRKLLIKQPEHGRWVLEEIIWDDEVLCGHIQQVMIRAKVVASDVIHAWDPGGVGSIASNDLVDLVHKLFSPSLEELWQAELKEIAVKTVGALCKGGARGAGGAQEALESIATVDVKELEIWLSSSVPIGGQPPLKPNAKRFQKTGQGFKLRSSSSMTREAAERAAERAAIAAKAAKTKIAERVAADIAAAAEKSTRGLLAQTLRECASAFEFEQHLGGGGGGKAERLPLKPASQSKSSTRMRWEADALAATRADSREPRPESAGLRAEVPRLRTSASYASFSIPRNMRLQALSAAPASQLFVPRKRPSGSAPSYPLGEGRRPPVHVAWPPIERVDHVNRRPNSPDALARLYCLPDARPTSPSRPTSAPTKHPTLSPTKTRPRTASAKSPSVKAQQIQEQSLDSKLALLSTSTSTSNAACLLVYEDGSVQ